jgi:hypothetical protein
MKAPLPADQEMMARVLKGQEHLTVEQQLRNVCESFSIVQADNVRLYALADKQDDEIERITTDLARAQASLALRDNEVAQLRMDVKQHEGNANEAIRLTADNERLRGALHFIRDELTGEETDPQDVYSYVLAILAGGQPKHADVTPPQEAT